jgi:hypothetical protein
MLRAIRTLAVALLGGALLAAPSQAAAQVTTSAMRGSVTDSAGRPLEGAQIEAIHQPSGSRYAATTRADGRFTLPGLRVGGPYTVSAARLGYQRQTQGNISLALGVSADVSFRMVAAAVQLTAVTVQAEAGVMASTRTGAATQVSREALEQLPTISRRISDFVRLTPQFTGGGSFAGVDNRLNNISVDGSYFNNSFGLGGQPGDRTGVSPISLDAIEQVQVSIAPFDVRQGNFVGAAVNTVTKSGTNSFTGSLYRLSRDEGMSGRDAGANRFNPGRFNFGQFGATLGGPIIKDRLFFFASYEDDQLAQPMTTFLANTGGQTVTGNVTRVLQSDLDQLSTFLQQKFNYATGPYQGYDRETPSTRFLGKLDFNLNPRNKLSLRYSQLESVSDVIMSGSSSLGFGGRNNNSNAMSFANSNYGIQENIRSVVGEYNAQFGGNMANQLIVGYTKHDESRVSKGGMFPTVDILNNGQTYASFGFEPFTPNNELRYNSFQVQNNFHIYGDRHDLTFGTSLEWYESENVFFPGSQSVYVYNSLTDFYTDANDFLANPSRTTSPVNLRRFQVRYANIPGMEKPVQPLEVLYAGGYAQDEWRATDNLRVTAGIRVEQARFGNTAFTNSAADQLAFRDEAGKSVRYGSGKLPDPTLLFSPRLGFNWDVRGEGTTKVRGGTGVFTGRPAYVWISNQIGNTGVLTGFEELNNTTARPFNPNPDRYKPASVTGAPAASYELALTDPDFMFPQVWRSNLAVDRKLPWGLTGTAEFLYGRDVNGVYYINANLPAPSSAFTGPDARPRWTTGNRIHSNVANAIVLKNQDVGTNYNVSFSLERAFQGGLFLKGAYSYGISRNTVDPGSIAFGTWNNNEHAGDPNNPGVGYSLNSQGNRWFAVASYKKDYLKAGATGISLFVESFVNGQGSYRFSGDLNGDGGFSNDLIYVPRNASEMNFEAYTASGRTFSVAEQQAAFETFIGQSGYLASRRGQYAERGGAFGRMVTRADLSVTQDLFRNVGSLRNRVQLRLDVLNFTNLVNRRWGVSYRFRNTQPLIARGADANGRALYRMANFGNVLLGEGAQRGEFIANAGAGDVWRMQLGLRYNFN